jgi:Luciferase-like monooxygenase
VLTYDFRLPPGPRTAEYARLAEDLGFRAVWCPEVPAFGHDIWVTLARIAEKTSRIKFGPAVLTPSYRHPMAQASANRNTRADRAGTPDGWVRHRLYGPSGDGQEALEPREHAYAYHAG